MKEKLLSIAIAVMLIAVTAMPVFAGSHHGGTQTVKYSVCADKNCIETEVHTHSGKTYTAHYYSDGHNYHKYCTVEDCIIAEYHSHDGTYCFGHTANDGHDYHNYCGISNCALTEYHEHDGAYCFGHTANDGHSYHYANRGHH